MRSSEPGSPHEVVMCSPRPVTRSVPRSVVPPTRSRRPRRCNLSWTRCRGLGEHNNRSLALYAKLGLHSDSYSHAVMNTAVCALMLNDPHTAIEAANHYQELQPPFLSGDAIRALAYHALGDLEMATAAARTQARIAVTGRFVQTAADILLVLAVFAKAEDDLPTARELVLNMGQCRTAELTAYARHFAHQLGIRSEFAESQRPVLSDQGDLIRRRAADDVVTLHREMTRRGWN
jgi:hypothetical protein